MRRLLLLAVLGTSCATASGEVELRFKPSVAVTGEQVTLADVAELRGDDSACLSALRDIDLGAAPKAGNGLEINRFEVDAWIHTQRPSLPCRLNWTGLSHVSVRAPGHAVDLDQLLASAGDLLRSELSRHYQDVAVQPTEVRMRTPEVAEGTRIEFRLPDLSRPRSRLAVLAELHDPNGHSRSVPLWFEVSAFAPVWVADRDLKVGAPLLMTDVHRQTVDIARLGAQPVALDASFDALVIARPLAEGAPLREADVSKRRAIEAGSPVTVHARAGAVAVQTAGIALQSSDVGDHLFVRLPRSQEVVAATAVRHGVVEVAE